MRKGLRALTAAAIALAGCDLPGKPDPSVRYQRPETVLDVSTLFAENCSGCHGEPGRLGPARNLGDPLFLAVVGKHELRRIITDGVPGTSMPAFSLAEGGWLTDRQIDALADGIIERWSTPSAFAGKTLPAYSEAGARKAGVAPGDVKRGADVYATYCGSCHDGAAAENRGGQITTGTFLALTSDQALRSAVIAGRSELHMPSYDDYSGRPALGAQQISDVTAWLVAQRKPFPGRPYPVDDVAADSK